MIASGEKKEEYREIKSYWIKRLLIDVEVRNPAISYEILASLIAAGDDFNVGYSFQDFDIVSANNGYAKDCPNIKWQHKGIRIGEGKPEWGAEPGKKYFILEIGELLKQAV